MTTLNMLSVAEAAIALASGQITSEALIQDCLKQIKERNNEIQAWTCVNEEFALEQARACDQASQRLSPLHGIPVGIKDLIDTAILPTTYGSTLYANHQPQLDSDCVANLKKAGAVILGKTVTTEFAYYSPGPTRNPHNQAHTPGGSSSGSAAAVADHQVPFAIGTQTVGSMIRPGSFNGIVALKPSFGTLSYTGTKSLSPSLDTLGLFSRTIGDQRILLTALAPHMEISDSRPDPVIAVCKTPFWDSASPAMQEAFLAYVYKVRAAGFRTVEYEMGPAFADLAEAHLDIMSSEAQRCLSPEANAHPDQVSEHVHRLIARGAGVTPAREAQCRNLLARCQYKLQQLFKEFDYFLVPAAPGEAPEGLSSTGDPVFNRIWTFLGVPCITYPMSNGPQGLPLGIQLIAPFGADHSLIDMADKLKAKTL